jgi:hypothetical protein
MATEWAYEYIIAFNAADVETIGKAFVKKMSPYGESEDAAFDGYKLVPLGQPEVEPVAYATVCPCKQDFYDFVKAAKEGADFSDSRYDYGKNKGVTLAQFNALKSAVLFIAVRQIRDLETNEEIPRPISMDEYLANKGYEIKVEAEE